jgi:hypothetical protein
MTRALICILLLRATAGFAAGDSKDSWYMRETAMTEDGRLTFLNRPWWPRAQALREGGNFTLDLNGDGRPDTMVARKDGHLIEAIDDTGRASDIWNTAGTCYVVSLKGDGIVDRMVVYLDNDGDGKADEMELRHYRNGYLRYAWFGENYDRDGAQIFALKDWSYAGNNAGNKFRGNLMIYLNKYDPRTKSWLPLSECPFAFWDSNRDGHGETVLRVSAAPLASLTGPDSDYANNYSYMWAPEATPLAEMGNLNVRLSFNIDPQPRRDPLNKPHYNFGFTSTGKAPYRYDGMTYTNPRRRPPQTVTRIAWKDGIAVGVNYPAAETAFTWDESRSVWRWEGQFWIYERVYLSNTGGPTWRWNMRREYAPGPSERRRIYYSGADKRYHLMGAAEGWLEAGHLVNDRKDLEFRWFDRDRDGYLDTVQVFEGASDLPVRENRFDPRAREVTLDREALAAEYNGRVLPQAIEADLRIIAAMKRLAQAPASEAYEAEAARAETAERRRYCLDIARELLFLEVRKTLRARNAALPYPNGAPDRARTRSMEPGSGDKGYSMGDALRFWETERRIARFEQEYADGRYAEAEKTLAAFR